MADHPLPEMMRLSLSDLALRIKIMKVKLGTSIEDVLTRALDPPSSINIQRAVSALVEVRSRTFVPVVVGEIDQHGIFCRLKSMTKCISGPRLDSNGGNHPYGTVVEQTAHRRAFGQIPPCRSDLPMLGPSLDHCRGPQL